MASVDACATPKACSSKAGGVGVSPTPPDKTPNAANAEGVSVGSTQRVRMQRRRVAGRRVRSRGDPVGVGGVCRRDRGSRRDAATPGCRRESLRDWGRASVDACATPKAFPWDQPGIIACNIIAASCPFPRRPLQGRGHFVARTGGRGETPQPPAVDGNRFAIENGLDRRERHAEGVFVESRGCRRFADTPGQDDQRGPTPKAFPRDRSDAVACNVVAASDIVHVPTATPSGSGALVAVTGGCGETPQPPAVNGNRFAIEVG